MIDRILIIDDEFLIRDLLEEIARRNNIDVVTAASGEEALKILEHEEFQIIFSDMKMKQLTGLDVLRYCNQHCPHTLFVIMTAYGTIETAIEAMRLNAFDFFMKPFSPDQVDIVLEKAKSWLRLSEQNNYLNQELTGSTSNERRTRGESSAVKEINRLVDRVAPTDATVLINGESGTGKELIAADIHRLSDQKGNKPYIRLNCAALPEHLLESELFGHEKGAFTGAIDRRIGRFELAHGGTILLDEISEITPTMQAKLLRVLQESEFERVGGTKTISINVRVIATTNRDLRQEVNAGTFREDLYYRLNVFPISLPPLRQRDNDAVILAQHFLQIQAKKRGRSLDFNDSAVKLIISYNWPGNIRELEHAIERVAILEDGPLIGSHAFPAYMGTSTAQTAVLQAGQKQTLNLKEIERRTIQEAMTVTGGNRTKAADLLGFSVRTLRNKLNEFEFSG